MVWLTVTSQKTPILLLAVTVQCTYDTEHTKAQLA